MTRIRASALFVGIAVVEFVFEQLQRRSDPQTEYFAIVAILLIVMALLTLVLSTRIVVIYGSVIVLTILLLTTTDLLNDSLSGMSKALSFFGGLILAWVLVAVLRHVGRANWVQNRRYIQSIDDPWVSLDKGIDPTIGSGKEGS